MCSRLTKKKTTRREKRHFCRKIGWLGAPHFIFETWEFFDGHIEHAEADGVRRALGMPRKQHPGSKKSEEPLTARFWVRFSSGNTNLDIKLKKKFF